MAAAKIRFLTFRTFSDVSDFFGRFWPVLAAAAKKIDFFGLFFVCFLSFFRVSVFCLGVFVFSD